MDRRFFTAFRTTILAGVALAIVGAVFLSSPRLGAQQPATTAPLTILQLNDVYTTGPIGNDGGLARVATLKKRIAAEGRTPFLVLAGDFLSSSAESAVFRGEQMIATLNAAGLDMATLGNHEFDFGADVLITRMAEAKWQWVVSNVIDARTGQPIGGALPYTVRTFGTLRVGFIGLCLTTGVLQRERPPRLRFVDPLEAAATYIPRLKGERADVIVALTHLTVDDDRALAERFPEIDLIVGGHEHYPITAAVNRTLISKAGSDARFLGRIDVTRRDSGVVERLHALLPVDASIPDDPATAAVAEGFRARMSAESGVIVGTTNVPLDGLEEHIRVSETNLGNFVADAIRAEVEADVAIVNAGAIRGDKIFPQGRISRATLLEIHPFGNVVCKIALSGLRLLEALNHGVARLPAAAGQFLQVSGISMRVSGTPAVVSNVRINGEPLDGGKTYTLALSDYLLVGGDGYAMFPSQRVLIAPESGRPLVTALEHYLAQHSQPEAAVDGRIVR